MAYKNKSKSAPVAIIIAVLVIILAAALIIFFGGDGTGPLGAIKDDILGQGGVQNDTQIDLIDASDLPDSTIPVQETQEDGATVITLNGSEINVDGAGAAADGNSVVIIQSGIYSISGTLDDGRIVVNAKGQDVVLILDGVNVTCSNSSPLYIYKAASVTLLLNGTKENVFTDGTSYDYTLKYCNSTDDEPNACIYSKGDLIIRGTGSLKVNANYNSGIISKDTLQIINTTVDVEAKNNGINGKDSLTIQNATVHVNAGGDALRSTKDNDPSLGWAVFTDSNIYLTTKDGDGVQVETGITIDNCSISITTADGATGKSTGSSTKGIKCSQGYITVNSGTIVIDSTDDAFHSAGNINLNGGTISIATGDDAVHSDANIYVTDGVISMPDCHEGLEGALIEISGGYIYIVADDDGINASGGNDTSGYGNMFMSDGSYLGITGGYIYIDSEGDGIDSNGDIYMSGGTLIISGPTSSMDGAIDYNGDFHIDGGLLFAAGSAGMAEAPDNMTINTLSVTFDSVLDAGTYISISGGGKEFVFQVQKQTGNIVFSSPELENGVEYTISYGGKYSGETKDSVCSGGKYSGGKELATVTLIEGLNSYGQVGIGGTMGGGHFGNPGQFGGMGGEGKDNPFRGRGQGGGRGMNGERNNGDAPDDVPEIPDGGFDNMPDGMPNMMPNGGFEGIGGGNAPEPPDGFDGQQPPEPPEN